MGSHGLLAGVTTAGFLRVVRSKMPRPIPAARLSAFLRSLGDVACTFARPNPKRARGNNEAACRRYDGYASAATVGAFFACGGTVADLVYDIAREYCTVGALDAALAAFDWRPNEVAALSAPPRRKRPRDEAPPPKATGADPDGCWTCACGTRNLPLFATCEGCRAAYPEDVAPVTPAVTAREPAAATARELAATARALADRRAELRTLPYDRLVGASRALATDARHAGDAVTAGIGRLKGAVAAQERVVAAAREALDREAAAARALGDDLAALERVRALLAVPEDRG